MIEGATLLFVLAAMVAVGIGTTTTLTRRQNTCLVVVAVLT